MPPNPPTGAAYEAAAFSSHVDLAHKLGNPLLKSWIRHCKGIWGTCPPPRKIEIFGALRCILVAFEAKSSAYFITISAQNV